MRTIHFLIAGLFVLALAGCAAIARPEAPAAASIPNTDLAEYGQPVTFRPGRALQFPDFSLTYLGERVVTSENPPVTFSLHDFAVAQDDETAYVSWSSGLGDIAPTAFTVGGSDYLLELAYSDELGDLADNHLVVWRASNSPTSPPTPTVQDDSQLTVALDQPFDLRRRQRASLEGEQFAVELRRVTDDSRCPVDEKGQHMICVWVGEGVVDLSVYQGDAPRQRVALGTANRAAPNSADVGDFTIQLLDLTPLPSINAPQPAQADYTAVLQISRRGAPPTATPVPAPTATPLPKPTPTTHYAIEIVIDCGRLTGQDAEAVLGEPVGRNSLMLNFFCLESSAARADAPAPDDFPIYLGDYQDRNVVAATQWGIGDQPDPLLDLAERVIAAHPAADAGAYQQLRADHAAGALTDAFAQLPLMAAGAHGLNVEMVDGLGRAALWLWQEQPDDRHFAALLTLEKGKYIVVYALIGAQQNETAARDAMVTVSRRMNGE